MKRTRNVVRSTNSYSIGAETVPDIVERFKSCGMSYATVCDINTLSSSYLLQRECDKHGLKPFFGIEINCVKDHTKKVASAEDLSIKSEEEIRDEGYMSSQYDYGHVRLWAKSDEGIINLNKLSTLSYDEDHFYYTPRVDVNEILQNSNGLIFSTGGLGSYINREIESNNFQFALELLEELHDAFASDLVIEIPVVRSSKAIAIAKFYKRIRDKIPEATYIASGVCVALDDIEKHKILQACDKKEVEDLDDFGLDGVGTFEYSESELTTLKIFGFNDDEIDELFNNVNKIVSRSSAKIVFNPFAMIIPDVVGDPEKKLDHDQYLRKVCEEAMAEFKLVGKKEYEERLEYELTALKNQKFSGYILYVMYALDIARKFNIPVGPGRGSAAGSLVNYLVKNTSIDPIRFNLSFERYIDPQRIDPPDNDLDFPPSKIKLIIEEFERILGTECVARLTTYTKYSNKSAFDDVGRFVGVPYETRLKVLKKFDDKGDKKKKTSEVLQKPEIQSLLKKFDTDYIGEKADKIIGLYKSPGIHPAAVVAASEPIYNYMPVETRKPKKDEEGITEKGRRRVAAFDMNGVDASGLLKIDYLGLNTIEILDDAAKLVSEDFNLNDIPIDDEKTLELFRKGDFSAVFQFDTSTFYSFCSKFNKPFDNFMFLAAATSLIRPGPLDSGQAYKFVHRYNNDEDGAGEYHPIVDEITRETRGILIYQEQVSEVFKRVGDHDNPDKMRKLISKSKGAQELEPHRDKFVENGLKKPGMTIEILNRLFDDIVEFGRYGFNKSHAVAYARISYNCQYMKANHPLEFWHSVIRHSPESDRRAYVLKAASYGIKAIDADIQVSGVDVGINRELNAVVSGLSNIKGIGHTTAKEIISLRPFNTISDLYEKLGPGSLKLLAAGGAIRNLVPNLRYFENSLDDIVHKIGLKTNPLTPQNVLKHHPALADGGDSNDYTDYEKRVKYVMNNTFCLDNPFIEYIDEKVYPHIRNSIHKTNDTDPLVLKALMKGEGSFWIAGYVSNLKKYENTPREGRDAEEKHISNKKTTAKCRISTSKGHQYDVGISWELYEDTPVKDGSYVIMSVNVFADRFYADAIVDLTNLRRSHGVDLSIFEGFNLVEAKLIKNQYAFGHSNYNHAMMNLDKMKKRCFSDEHDFSSLKCFGVITSIKHILTKNDKEIFIYHLLCPRGQISFTVFSRAYYSSSEIMSAKIGDPIAVNLKANSYQGKQSFILNDSESFMILKTARLAQSTKKV